MNTMRLSSSFEPLSRRGETPRLADALNGIGCGGERIDQDDQGRVSWRGRMPSLERSRGEGPLSSGGAVGVVLVVAVLIALAGCGAAPQNASSTTAETKHASMPAMPSSLTPATANTTSAQSAGASLPARSVYDAQPDFSGLGPLRFGMDAQQMHKAWTQPLYGAAPANDPHACYYLRPRKDDYGLLLMMEGGKFVRVDVRNDSTITAPGGGRVGMTADALRKLYAGSIEAAPNKYDAAAQTLRVASPHGEPARLALEVDAGDKVTSWRIGLPPQVDYVEGCS